MPFSSGNNPFIHNDENSSHPLGRGLSSLIPKKNNAASFGDNHHQSISPASYFPKASAGVANQIFQVPPSLVQINPYQPRKEFESQALESLKNSIREHGIIQPLIVTQTMGGRYELVAGERRLRAAKELNLKTVPVIMRAAKDSEKLELSLIENIQRADLNPIEKANAYAQLIANFNLTQEEAARRLGIARSTLNNSLRLLNLPVDIQQGLIAGKISESQAKLILSVDGEKDREKIFHRAKDGNLTVKDTEHEIKKIKVKAHTRNLKKEPRLLSWESQLSSALGTKVSIRRRGHGGLLEIEFYSEEELQNIVTSLLR
ncbi:MAG: ParB-like protein partition protein [Candidatus Kuenenbacteria bacterium GW2011_GWA2_42_15]|uniref:ParB-like protein partition protein n=1 Tax=Candidatus Kuenenbacteria bacterium GW2011_GWA2_42_15 TaxID=1618677 RepID=A0A0G1C1N7_9BACT|nr:MAG: ParB-like protein partition protein [Candidatus Kuenenbacteria bacterium GW2011_GWA2_42_15]